MENEETPEEKNDPPPEGNAGRKSTGRTTLGGKPFRKAGPEFYERFGKNLLLLKALTTPSSKSAPEESDEERIDRERMKARYLRSQGRRSGES